MKGKDSFVTSGGWNCKAHEEAEQGISDFVHNAILFTSPEHICNLKYNKVFNKWINKASFFWWSFPYPKKAQKQMKVIPKQ